ncbi:hypothetical protein [Vibrio hepatarius]|uniref:hypothetical protein n=1 Tax=Vibrio hepatarius TaxID=171383 RepID=UPI001C0A2B2E|nr:hypothetical protein [Vibrio hepatarius]MBU2899336.1 hypothetical protein [Vibrio hepatarius]
MNNNEDPESEIKSIKIEGVNLFIEEDISDWIIDIEHFESIENLDEEYQIPYINSDFEFDKNY